MTVLVVVLLGILAMQLSAIIWALIDIRSMLSRIEMTETKMLDVLARMGRRPL